MNSNLDCMYKKLWPQSGPKSTAHPRAAQPSPWHQRPRTPKCKSPWPRFQWTLAACCWRPPFWPFEPLRAQAEGINHVICLNLLCPKCSKSWIFRRPAISAIFPPISAIFRSPDFQVIPAKSTIKGLLKLFRAIFL